MNLRTPVGVAIATVLLMACGKKQNIDTRPGPPPPSETQTKLVGEWVSKREANDNNKNGQPDDSEISVVDSFAIMTLNFKADSTGGMGGPYIEHVFGGDFPISWNMENDDKDIAIKEENGRPMFLYRIYSISDNELVLNTDIYADPAGWIFFERK